ncbi:DNA-processing protein DprA [Abyssalbus ytuae]|uniref:DNA-processing protein DprA n=1 Tax=Abyssalbus ytuae TaxID=2926907 RepID=A0A9E7D0H7_9FLAO|nr:DNA-processing protein DprA [Abyssalbus ytuae]UOB16028.1 DNA-processing protein DprA [Abyssalbus ytuae]
MTQTQLISVLALLNVKNIGDATAKKLIKYCGSAENVFKEKKNNLLKIDGIGELIIKDLYNPVHFKLAEEELKFVNNNQIQLSYFTDATYPEKLKHCLDGPVLIFKSGNIDLHNKKIISIVGTRQITTYGTAFCEKLIEDLSPLNPVIVSGFAYGVDICAQKTALKYGLQTIGCLAHGLNQVYPKVHEKYVAEIEKNGGFITDFWSKDNPERNNFLRRNRIIAGLSEGTIVIESAEKGGSLVTADIATSYNREVFAVPGRTDDKYSAGCNNLIKHQKAHVLTNAADVIYILNWKIEEEKKNRVVQKKLFIELDETEKNIYAFLQKNGKELIDIIALECKLPVHKVSTTLLNMELKGAIRPLPGKMFEAI